MPGGSGATQYQSFAAQNAITPPDQLGTGSQASLWDLFKSPLAVIGNVPGVKQVEEGLGWASHEFFRAGTAGILALGTPGGRDFGNLVQAWTDADSIPIGQAIAATPFDQALLATVSPLTDLLSGGDQHRTLNQMLAVPHTTLGGGIDVTDPAIRQQAFEQGGLGGVASWGIDTGVQFFFDPTVIGGKVARPLIALSRGAAPGVYHGLLREAGAAKFTPDQLAKIKAGIDDPNSAIGTANEIAFANRHRPGFLASHPVVKASSNPEGLTNVLQGAADKGEWDTLIMAAHGDPIARAVLKTQHIATYGALYGDAQLGTVGALSDLHDATMAVANFPLDGKIDPITGGPTPAWVVVQADRDHLTNVVNDLEDTLRHQQNAVGGGNDPGIFQSASTMGFSPNRQFNQWRERRAARGATRYDPTGEVPAGYWVGQRFRPVHGAPTVRKMTWFGSPMPAHWVGLNGPMKMASQSEILANVREAGGSVEQIYTHTKAFQDAKNVNEADAAINAMNEDLVRTKFLQHFPNVAVGSDEFHSLMSVAHSYLTQHNRWVADQMDQARGGRLYDQENAEFNHLTFLDDPENNMRPLPDWKALDDALKSMHPSVKDQLLHTRGAEAVQLAGTIGLQVWKPLVLLRVGGTIKNVSESWLASMIYLSSLPGNPVTGAARIAANFADKIATHPINPYRFNDRKTLRMMDGNLADTMDARSAAENARTLLEEAVGTAQAHRAYLDTLPTPATPGARYVLQGQRAQATRAITTAKAALVGSPIHAEVARLQIREDELRHTIAEFGARQARAPRRMAGRERVAANVGGPLDTPDNDQWLKSISGATKNDIIKSQYDIGRASARTLNDRLVAMHGQQVEYKPGPTAGRPALSGVRPPADEFATYVGHYSNMVNTVWRKNPAIIRLLRGDPIDEISDWLRNTDEGRAYLDQLPSWGRTEAEVDAALLEQNHLVRATAPSEALQQRIVAGDITPGEVHGFLYGRTDLQPIMDDQVLRLRDTHFWTAVNRIVDKAFELLWTLPEDRLARIPLFNTIYRREMRFDLAHQADHLATLPQNEANDLIRAMQGAARQRAQHEVTRIIYSAGHRTAIAQKTRFIIPFLQVTMNRFNYYGSQFLENPQNMARLFLGWNAIHTAVDTDGQERVAVHLPDFVAKAAGIEDSPYLVFNKTSLNLINSGEPWWSPGSGPAVSIPLAEYLRRFPDTTPDWVKSVVGSHGLGVFPNNYYGNDALDLFVPAWLHRVRGAEGQDYVNTETMIYAQEMMKYRNGLRPDPPTDSEIQDRANGLWMFRVLGAFTLPAQPTLASGAPGQTAPAKGSTPSAEGLAAMVDLHRNYLAKYGKNGDAKFLADYPEYYDYMVTLSENPTGILPTDVSVARAKQYGDLVANLSDPKMGALVVNLAGDYGNFDADAYNWERGMKVSGTSDVEWRSTKTDPKQALDDRVIARGWQEYTNLTKWRDSVLKLYGYNSVRSAGAQWVGALFDDKLNTIIKDTSWTDASGHQVTPWWDDFKTQDDAIYAHRAEDLARIVSAPGYYESNIGKQPWLQTAVSYLKLRSQVGQILQYLKSTGGSGSLRAQSNQWLATIWDEKTKEMRDADPQWADIANFKFAHDDISSVPGEVVIQ